MPQTFQLTERIAGIVVRGGRAGEAVEVQTREALTSLDGSVIIWRLEKLNNAIFSRIPNLPPPSQIDHLVIVISPDLQATAYVNELQPVAQVRVGRAVQAGEAIYTNDIVALTAYDLGIPIATNSAVIVVRSYGWRRALFYDFFPLHDNAPERTYDLSVALAEQTLSLIAQEFATPPAAVIRQAIEELEALLRDRCEDEARYQELLNRYPWFLGGQHLAIDRHTNLDERNIPDFTGVRARDAARDVFEIKQPFMKCFRRDGHFSADFNAAWEQAERYLTFVRNHHEYLRTEKGLVFSNPRCFLLIGSGLAPEQIRRFHEREANSPLISILTYEQVLRLGQALLVLVENAGRPAAEPPAG